MFKMLIVDDNNRDRRILQSILPWEEYQIRIMGSAADGEEALEIAKKEFPDILLTDISMPRLNGIELAKEIGKLAPSTQVIFISCYSDFEYAKQAVNLNVFGYVNKPLNREELAGIAERVTGVCRMRDTQNQERAEMMRQLEATLPAAQEEFLRELLLGQDYDARQLADMTRFLKLPADRARRFQAAVLRFSGETDDVEQQYYVNYNLRQWAERRNTDEASVFLIRISPVEYTAIWFFNRGLSGQVDDLVLEVTSKLYSYYTGRYHSECTIGISMPGSQLKELPKLYRQAVQAVQSKFYTVGVPILLYRDIQEGAQEEFPAHSSQEWGDALREVVDGGTKADAERFVDRYFWSNGHHYPESVYKQWAFSLLGQLHLILAEQSFSLTDLPSGEDVFAAISRFQRIYELNSWMKQILQEAMALLQGENASRDEKLVASIKKIIHVRYSEQITAESIAESVYLSSKQANNIFRKKTGMTIFDYLVEYRIEIAKKLLRDPGNRIYQVAEQVGYQNKSYFALIFKKMTGMTPAEYRNQPK